MEVRSSSRRLAVDERPCGKRGALVEQRQTLIDCRHVGRASEEMFLANLKLSLLVDDTAMDDRVNHFCEHSNLPSI